MTTEERLEILERELAQTKRRNLWFLAVLGLAVGLFALGWYFTGTTGRAAEGGVKEVRASKFILVDENGKTRAELRADKSGAVVLSLMGENGKNRAGLYVGKDEPGLGLLDANGKLRAMLTVNKDGPGLSLFDANGTIRAGLGLYKGEPVLVLSDENGKNRAELDVAKNGPKLGLFDDNGRLIWSAPR